MFVQNFGEEAAKLTLDGEYTDLLTAERLSGKISVDKFGCRVILKQ